MSNPFYSPEDEVDDDEFLRHPRSGVGGYMLPQHGNSSGASPYSAPSAAESEDQMRQRMQQRRREIEERTLESSQRSLGLIFESEKTGQATAADLARQKEQLRNTEARLDGINSQLKQSERHITGIKSVFGGLGNWFRGRNNPAAGGATGASTSGAASSSSPYTSSGGATGAERPDYGDSQRLDQLRKDNHPGLRTTGGAGARSGNEVDQILDGHLDEMSLGLSRLKGLATDLNKELDEHNEILDRLDDKTSSTQIRVSKQNKEIGKLLGKK